MAPRARLRKRPQLSGIPTNRCKFMAQSDKKILAAMPKLNSRRVPMLLEEVIGCRWTISVLGAVAGGVRRPGALERHIAGISAKVLADRLPFYSRGHFRKGPISGNSTASRISPDRIRQEIYAPAQRSEEIAGG